MRLDQINFIGWLDGLQGIYRNPYTKSSNPAEFAAYNSGHNKSRPKKYGRLQENVRATQG